MFATEDLETGFIRPGTKLLLSLRRVIRE